MESSGKAYHHVLCLRKLTGVPITSSELISTYCILPKYKCKNQNLSFPPLYIFSPSLPSPFSHSAVSLIVHKSWVPRTHHIPFPHSPSSLSVSVCFHCNVPDQSIPFQQISPQIEINTEKENGYDLQGAQSLLGAFFLYEIVNIAPNSHNNNHKRSVRSDLSISILLNYIQLSWYINTWVAINTVRGPCARDEKSKQ